LLGATRLRVLREITSPLIRSGLVCRRGVSCSSERSGRYSAAILLFTAPTRTIAVVIYDLNESGDTGSIAVLGLFADGG